MYYPNTTVPIRRERSWSIDTGRMHWRLILAIVLSFLTMAVVSSVVTNSVPGGTYTVREMVEQQFAVDAPDLNGAALHNAELAITERCEGRSTPVGLMALISTQANDEADKAADLVAQHMGCS